jgi:hypothetical protein
MGELFDRSPTVDRPPRSEALHAVIGRFEYRWTESALSVFLGLEAATD